jgi:glycosyltransferase involved in cell wall biosynthesis
VPPRVSVIIATYNWSSVLPYSIGSALRQTMADLEVLVVGDACTDDSEQVVAAFGDARVRWINLPKNSGHQSGPNNEGLRQARGELIAYLGHDDLWLPHHLETHAAALDATGAALSSSLLALVFPGGEVWPVAPRLEEGTAGPPSCTVHRRGMTETLRGWRDYREIHDPPEMDLWRRAHEAGFRFTFVPRLTAIKFPASARRGVYQTRPSHEQAAWSARIASEPDFEAKQLARVIMDSREAKRMSYLELWKQLLDETRLRVPRWFSQPSRFLWNRKRNVIREARRFKGL